MRILYYDKKNNFKAFLVNNKLNDNGYPVGGNPILCRMKVLTPTADNVLMFTMSSCHSCSSWPSYAMILLAYPGVSRPICYFNVIHEHRGSAAIWIDVAAEHGEVLLRHFGDFVGHDAVYW